MFLREISAPHVFLAKYNDDVISHCRCENSLVAMPMQLECPWCGCGWLNICSTCHRAFTFARGVMIDDSWESLAERELKSRQRRPPTRQDIESCAESMQVMMRGVEVGKTYVYLDGYFIATDTEQLNFDGWHSRHRLSFLPQVRALTDPEVLDETFGSEKYWKLNQIAV